MVRLGPARAVLLAALALLPLASVGMVALPQPSQDDPLFFAFDLTELEGRYVIPQGQPIDPRDLDGVLGPGGRSPTSSPSSPSTTPRTSPAPSPPTSSSSTTASSSTSPWRLRDGEEDAVFPPDVGAWGTNDMVGGGMEVTEDGRVIYSAECRHPLASGDLCNVAWQGGESVALL